MMDDLEYDARIPNPDEFRRDLLALQDSMSELLRSISFAIAIKQHCHVTEQDAADLPAATINAIREAAYAVADEVNRELDSGSATSVEFRDLLDRATEKELERMASASILKRKDKKKYKLDIHMFGNHTTTAKQAKTLEQNTALYVKMLQGVGVNALRAASNSQIQRTHKGVAFLQQDTLTVTFDSYDKLKRGLTTGAKKLLDMGSIRLAQLNNYAGAAPSLSTDRIKTSVSIPLEEYGRLRGYDVQPRATSTPEEAEAEKKRINNVYCNIRKAANAEMETLFSMSLSWTEPRGTGNKRKLRDFVDVRLLQAKGIKNGHIHLQFTEAITHYLTHAYVMPYPTALLAIDEYSERTYNIGFKLAYHHGFTNNIKRGTNHIISVEDLLNACGDMPRAEDINKTTDRGHWKRRIKEPLENSLDLLKKQKVITQWEFSNAKGEPLTDSQLDNGSDGGSNVAFESLYVVFDLPDEHL